MRPSRIEENAIHPISDEELRTAIGKLKVGRAPWQNDITAEMMKYLGEEAREILRNLLNYIIESKKKQNDWKMSIVLPLFKKGDAKECSNYRIT